VCNECHSDNNHILCQYMVPFLGVIIFSPLLYENGGLKALMNITYHLNTTELKRLMSRDYYQYNDGYSSVNNCEAYNGSTIYDYCSDCVTLYTASWNNNFMSPYTYVLTDGIHCRDSICNSSLNKLGEASPEQLTEVS
jgi:hypothetical protein